VRAAWQAVRAELMAEADLVDQISQQLAVFRVREVIPVCHLNIEPFTDQL
jgi:hypothetical protein